MTLKLTVIDQSPRHGDRAPGEALNTSVELSIACDALGYYRYWLAEHHDSIHFAGSAPEILIARIASATRHMRVGSGGVMLTHYSPFKVAETFATLGALFPNRIDLGIGRAPGGSSLSATALASPGHPELHDHFPRQAAELCAFLCDCFPADHPFAQLKCLPAPSALPELWMLGSGGGSAGLAGALGMGLALARFIAPRTCSPTIFDHHAQALQQSGRSHPPARLLALAVICAESMTPEETLEHLKKKATPRTRRTLDAIYKVCMGQVERDTYDFAYPTISKLGLGTGVPKAQSIRNATGEP